MGSPTVAPSVSSSLRPTLISSSPTGNPTSSFSPTTDKVSSKRWRLWTHKDLTTSVWVWDVKLITFFKSSDCSEDSAIPNNGTPIDSANAGASFVPDFAFKSNHFWGGRYVNDYFYVGMSFSDSKKIQCIQMINGGLHNVRELTVQAFDEADSAWKDVYIAKNLSQAAFGVNRMQLYSSPVVPTPSPSSSPTSSPTSPVTSSSAAPSAALTASPSAAPSAALTASPVNSPSAAPTASPVNSQSAAPSASPVLSNECPSGQAMMVLTVTADGKSKKQNIFTVKRRNAKNKFKIQAWKKISFLII